MTSIADTLNELHGLGDVARHVGFSS